MAKWQSQDFSLAFTSFGILLTAFADKIEEWTSISFNVVMAIAMVLLLIPLYIWISGWLKNRK
jgi:predicted membrane channel-forming protein YqfA (hemolysin III family)